MAEKCIVFLCQQHELTRERRGYFRAFSKRLPTIVTPIVTRNNREHFAELLPKNMQPILVLQPEASPRLPSGLHESRIPTGCFQIDTYSGTEKRMRWSMLYDYAFVFHPGYERMLEEAGHPRAICVPHAVEADLFNPANGERTFDVGWVGNLKGDFYKARRKLVSALPSAFRTNAFDRSYSFDELIDIYSHSRIVVNVSRDDFLCDANLRCFEAMAAGALLMTPKPSELSQIGFVENMHFVTFLDEREMQEKLRYFLDREVERREIAERGRKLVAANHTYENRVEKIINTLEADKGHLFSPARNWDSVSVQETYLHYFAKNLMLDSAVNELRNIAGQSRRRALTNLPMVGKAFVRAVQLSMRNEY